MRQLSNHWTDVIAEASEDYQNATVTFYDDSLVEYGEYDAATDEQEVIGDPEFWTGPARIIGVRWGVNRENSDYGNASTQTSIRVQIPKNTPFDLGDDPVYRLKRGVKMRVNVCEDNPSLLTKWFSCTSDLQGSNAASRTFQFSLDGDSVAPEADDG